MRQVFRIWHMGRVVAGVVAGGIWIANLAGCAEMQPSYALEVQGHVQSLATSGSVLIGDFLGNKTYLWDWGNLRRPSQVFDRGQALTVGLMGPKYVFAESPAGQSHVQPAVIVQERYSRRVVRQWPFSANWYCSEFISSPNGRYMGVLLEENNPTGGDTCLGLAGLGSGGLSLVPAKGRTVKFAEDPLAVANDGRHMAVLGLGDMRAVVVADLAARRIIWRRAMARSRSVSFSPDGRILYVGGHYGIYAMMADSGRSLSAWSCEESRNLSSPVARIAASPDGRFVAAGTDAPDGAVYLFDAYTGRQVTHWSVAPKKTLIEGLAFSPSGLYLATADQYTQGIQIWEMPKPVKTGASRGGLLGTGLWRKGQQARNGR